MTAIEEDLKCAGVFGWHGEISTVMTKEISVGKIVGDKKYCIHKRADGFCGLLLRAQISRMVIRTLIFVIIQKLTLTWRQTFIPPTHH